MKSVDRCLGYETPQNRTAFICLASINCTPQIVDQLDQKIGTENTALFDIAEAGEISNPMQDITGGDAVLDHTDHTLATATDSTFSSGDSYTCFYKKSSAHILLRNTERHPCDIRLYEVVSKVDLNAATAEDAETGKQLLEYLLAATEESMMGGNIGSGNTLFANDQIVDAVDATATAPYHILSYDNYLQPQKQKVFNKLYRVLKAKSFRLQPGDEISWAMKSRPFTYNPFQWQSNGLTVESKKGVSRWLIARVSGVLGRGDAAGEHHIVGQMKADIAVQVRKYAKFIPQLKKSHAVLKFNQVQVDDLITAAVDLVGPSDHIRQAEDGVG